MAIKKTLERLIAVTVSVMLLVCASPMTTLASQNNCTHVYENGFCTSCWETEPAFVLTAETVTDFGLSQAYIGYYAIGNAGQLYWFSQLVNEEKHGHYFNVVLTDDIVVNENVLTETGELSENYKDFLVWDPIGYRITETEEYNFCYEGTFDGNNHSISGLYFDNSTVSNIGLFGYVRYESCIKNLSIKDSYFNGEDNVAGICAIMYNNGEVDSSNSPGRTYIENCSVDATIISTNTAGGICGDVSIDTTIKNCEANGKISVIDSTLESVVGLYAGGIVGVAGSGTIIKECTNNGDVTVTDNDAFNPHYVGGISAVTQGSILGCVNTGSLYAPDTVGGIVAHIGNTARIERCRNDGTVTANGNIAGGIVGEFNFTGTNETYVTDCYNTGKVAGDTFVGGIVGYHGVHGREGYELMAMVSNVYSTGDIEGRLYVGAITGVTGDYGCVRDSFYLHGSAKKTDGTVVTGYNWYGTAQYEMQISDSPGFTMGATEEQFASGEITYALNGYKSGNNVVWHQNIDRGDAEQPYPAFEGEIVYYIDCIYTNIPVEENHTHSYKNGFCSHPDCTVIEPCIKITANNYKSLGLTPNHVGYYGIGNTGQLYWFAELFEINSAPNIVLLNDIVDNEGVLDSDGNLAKGTYRSWTPLGAYGEQAFCGTFDGNGKTISGLYYKSTTEIGAGLFGYCENATIKSLEITDSYFHARYWAGGISGYAQSTLIEDCINNSCVEVKTNSAGGICGSAYKCEIKNCTNKGNVSAYIQAYATSNGKSGGICGSLDSSQISQCKNSGSIKGEVCVGGIAGYASSKSNSITNSVNEGAVFATSVDIGGILGAAGAETTLMKCANKGNITGLRDVAGICGSSTATTHISNCYNTADISATESIAGGICGKISRTNSEATDKTEICYNIGNVTAPLYVGGAVGQIADASDNPSEQPLLKNVYYLENCAIDSDNNPKTGVGSHNTYPDIYDAPDSDFGVEAVTKSQVSSGELAYILQSLQSPDEENKLTPMVWGQTTNCENACPILTENEAHKVIPAAGGSCYCVSGIGDTNADNEVNVKDYQQLVNKLLSDEFSQWYSPEYFAILNYDLDGDGIVDVLDASLMELVISGHNAIDVYDIGDADFNSVAFEESDIALIKESLKNPSELTTAQKRACDLNSDGVADNADMLLIDMQYNRQNCERCSSEQVITYSWSEDYSSCTASSYCSVCSNVKVTETVQASSEFTTEPTCLSYGNLLFTAAFTHPLFDTQTYESIEPALGHRYDTVTYTWADDYSTCKGTALCARCNGGKVTQTVNSVYTIEAGDCSTSGTVSYTATFTKSPLTPRTVIFEKDYIGHLYDNTEYVWSEDYSACTASRRCQGCGNELTETVETTSTVTRKATCTLTGIAKHTATFENELLGTTTKSEVIPKKDHAYETEYLWAEDYSSCKATSACSVCSAIGASEAVESICCVLTEATCLEDGFGEYTATFKNNIFETQITSGIIPAVPHHFSNATYQWGNNNTSCTASGTCINCGNKVTENGRITHNSSYATASFTSPGLETQTAKTSTVTYTTYDEVYGFVASLLACGKTDITVPLAPDAPAELITAIRRAICDAENVDDASINLTITGVTDIPDTTMVDETGKITECISFGPGNNFSSPASGLETVTQLKSVSLPDATRIGIGAFQDCCNLSSLYAPKAQIIESYAFSGTALTVIDLPEATSLGVYAFSNGYAEITLVNLPKATTLGIGLFSNVMDRPNNFADGAVVKLTAPGTEFTWLQVGEGSISSEPYLFGDDSDGTLNLVLHTDKASQIKKNLFPKTYKWSFTYNGKTFSYNFLSATTEG